MNVLVYEWKAYNYKDIIAIFRQMGFSVDVFSYKLSNYDEDEEFSKLLISKLESGSYDFVFTVNYFSVIADVCNCCHVDYCIWTCDDPLISLYNESAFYQGNHIFVFDMITTHELNNMGIRTHYLPLASNPNRLDKMFSGQKSKGRYPVSFVGSLYERNTYDKIQSTLPEYLRGYFDAVIEAQINISGGNIIEKMLTPQVLYDLDKYFKLEKSKGSISNLGLIFSTTVLGFKVAAVQRSRYLSSLSKRFELSVFSNSDLNCLPLANANGSVDYFTEMPVVFMESDININMTIPNIRSGISLRVWDVISSGGFLLTDFRAELLKYFTPDKDIVIYEDELELLDKTDYYLKHEQQRDEIAQRALQNVRCNHTIDKRIEELIKIFKEERVY